MTTARKRAASVRHPTMEAIVHGLFRFDEEWQAIKRMEAVKARFIVAKYQEADVWPPTLKLWIRAYELSDEEIAQGYHGHFALMRCVKLEDGKFTLTLTKLDVPLERHPQKKRPPQAHPDWQHPILR